MRRFVLILAMLGLTSSGCHLIAPLLRPSQPPIPPARPELQSLAKQPDGGICMDANDAAELLIYIEELEQEIGL